MDVPNESGIIRPPLSVPEQGRELPGGQLLTRQGNFWHTSRFLKSVRRLDSCAVRSTLDWHGFCFSCDAEKLTPVATRRSTVDSMYPPRRSQMRLMLHRQYIWQAGGEKIFIDKSRFVIGRADDCDFRSEDFLVSRHHCELTIEGDSVMIRDLASRNGTLVNDTKIHTDTQLDHNDTICVGCSFFHVRKLAEPSCLTHFSRLFERFHAPLKSRAVIA